MTLILGAVIGLMVGVRYGRKRPRSTFEPLVGQQARSVLIALPFAAAIVDPTARLQFANPLAHNLGMVDSTTLMVPAVAEYVHAARDAGATRDGQVELRRGLRRTPVDAFVSVTPMPEGRFLVTAHDDTSVMASEAARREFAVNVSHELKTPIGALALMVEAVESSADEPDTVREFTARMEREVARIGTLVQQIIHLSRVQASASVLEPRDVALEDVVVDAMGALESLAQARAVTVVNDVQPMAVRGDQELLTMAVRNLVENAVMYSGEAARVVVSTRRDDDVAVISVMDNGIGIAADDQKRMFERFYRADDARSRERGGTGLGLSIVKHVVRQHGGELDVWSKLGVGTTISVRLPVPKEEW